MRPARRIVVKGVRKRAVSTDDLAYAYFLMGKELVQEKRERKAAEKTAQRVARRAKGKTS